MLNYKAPLRDIRFVLHELVEASKTWESMKSDWDVGEDMVDAILEEGAKFAENEVAPLNQSGDKEGCQFNGGEVTTPKGFKEAYKKYIEGGWPSMPAPEEVGGQGLPKLINIVMSEILGSANWSWYMYPGLSHGAIHTLMKHGTPEQQEVYLTKLVSGEWTGTMCLTEAHCGSDLGILKTKATPNADGSYNITGTKIFISAGEHDLADNIVHIVIARIDGAPAGTKGISLFIVPKFLPNADGSIGEKNGVACGSIEHKMGIKASATCVMNFDNAKGFLVGTENKGMSSMFTFMNSARIGTAIQGVCHAEGSFQGALAYAKDRVAMRSLSGVKAPDREADPIIVHPDIRRMLLTQKAFAEGGRALCYYLGLQNDIASTSTNEQERQEADDLLAFLTPIAKAFLTEVGLEAANHGMQVYGGHGYISEWGMEQHVRDARISTIYEGTTGIQSLDLLGRKVLMSQGEMLRKFTKRVHVFCKGHIDTENMQEFVEPLSKLNREWIDVTTKIGMSALQNRDEVGAASVDYLMYSGYITMGFLWAKAAEVAYAKLEAGTDEEDFYKAKIQTAKFYFKRILPRTQSHKLCLEGGADVLMSMDVDHFSF